jgi:hypothetical protein
LLSGPRFHGSSYCDRHPSLEIPPLLPILSGWSLPFPWDYFGVARDSGAIAKAKRANRRFVFVVPSNGLKWLFLNTVSAAAVVMQEQTTSPAKKPENGQINKARPKPPVHAHQTAHYLLELVLVLVACFLGGKVGLAIPFTSGNVSPVWPPAGIAMAAMLVVGYRIWPAVAIAAFLVNFFTPIPHVAALGIAVGNTVGPLAGIWLLHRIPRFHPSLTRLRDVSD